MPASLRFIALLLLITPVCASAEPGVELDRAFRDSVAPFVKSYCVECHGGVKPKAELNLNGFTSMAAVVQAMPRWEAILKQLKSDAMPPEDARRHPSDEERQRVIAWIQEVRRYEAARTAGDPGPVFARRLSNAEYDYTIRDLTGVDLRPTKEFPVDPANEAGFDNTAESLTMSASLLRKHLDAARQIAEHLILKPDGLDFASHPVVTDTDRDKYVVRRILEFYQRQRIDYADYFLAAWRYQHRASLGRPDVTLAETAAEAGISAKYLATVWNVLTAAPQEVGPLAALQSLWRELPKPDDKPNDARAGCEKMRDFVVDLRQQLVPEVKNLAASPIHNGAQCLVLWKNRQFAANRTRYAGGALKIKNVRLPQDTRAAQAMDLPADAEAAQRFEAAFEPYCATFPDAFFVSERARVYLDPEKEKKLGGRLLSAGFHSMTGYFRDDRPLYDLVLDAAGQRELDRLWDEFDFINGAPIRQYTSFVWFERTDSRYLRDEEFDRFRAEDKEVTSEAKIRDLAELYLAKAQRNDASETAQEAIRTYFRDISARIRWLEQARREAEPEHLTALAALAQRAWRRPITSAEREELLAFYRSLREDEGLGHEEALRDCVASVVVSPRFCYRVDLPGPGTNDRGVRPLSDYALASRLSYFLWSSMPDEELLAHAAAGDLHSPQVLISQTRRMLQDDRVRGLATEFGGNWLDFRRFQEHNSVDRERFPAFDDELRLAMFEEPIRYFLDVVCHDRSVLEFLRGSHTFVNASLARHYGMTNLTLGSDKWVRVNDATRYGRGGLLPMAVFLTKNAPGLRTSPVKRGYWVARRLLGETIPPPPAEVPELPNDEAQLELSLRDTLAKHREHKACAGCHERFDGLGLVFEGYGPIGELRTLDLGGRPVETRSTFPGGSEGDGLQGLLTYLGRERQAEFVDNLCRKLLSYALSRSLQPSDDALLADLQAKLTTHDHRFSTLVETIVTSPQFVNKRPSNANALE